jgi:uncharacterized membrane protein
MVALAGRQGVLEALEREQVVVVAAAAEVVAPARLAGLVLVGPPTASFKARVALAAFPGRPLVLRAPPAELARMRSAAPAAEVAAAAAPVAMESVQAPRP